MRASFLLTVIALPLAAASIQASKPEDVGLSSERLQRIHQTIQRHIDGHDITGAVTLVARKGRIAHFEAHGLMDQESQKAMAKDGLFRSEERRVGKECRSRWSPDQSKK